MRERLYNVIVVVVGSLLLAGMAVVVIVKL